MYGSLHVQCQSVMSYFGSKHNLRHTF